MGPAVAPPVAPSDARAPNGSGEEALTSRFVGLADIAADLGESPETVRRWVATGTIGPMIKLPNGKWKMRRDDYDHWLVALVIDRRIA